MNYKTATFSLAIILSLIAFFSKSQTSKKSPQHSLTITYKGNMGVHISGAKTSVLIDGLHEYYGPEYLPTPETEIRKMAEQQKPFADLTMALFTHYHKDHYSSTLAKRFLRTAARKRVAGPPQVTDSLAGTQTLNAWNKNALLFTDTSAGLVIYAFNIPHTGRQRHSIVQNVAYLIKSGKSSILHIGDADMDASAFIRLKLGRIDCMIAPVWFLMDKEGIRIITEIIKPAKLVATHISPNAKQPLDKYILPGISTYFFTEINQMVNMPG
ncbi:MAG: MBL fold metallo-hydrolase [Chitinophagaceae bacterium]|nr:MBL fold metallo-hydrolase [Chitinophagaceae bacterium]